MLGAMGRKCLRAVPESSPFCMTPKAERPWETGEDGRVEPGLGGPNGSPNQRLYRTHGGRGIGKKALQIPRELRMELR